MRDDHSYQQRGVKTPLTALRVNAPQEKRSVGNRPSSARNDPLQRGGLKIGAPTKPSLLRRRQECPGFSRLPSRRLRRRHEIPVELTELPGTVVCAPTIWPFKEEIRGASNPQVWGLGLGSSYSDEEISGRFARTRVARFLTHNSFRRTTCAGGINKRHFEVAERFCKQSRAIASSNMPRERTDKSSSNFPAIRYEAWISYHD